MKDRKIVDMNDRGSEEQMGGMGENHNQNIMCVNNLFSLKEKNVLKEKTRSSRLLDLMIYVLGRKKGILS